MSKSVEHTSESTGWYKKLTDYPTASENPFLEQTVADMKVSVRRQAIRPKKGHGEAHLMLVDGLGEEHGEAAFVRQVEVDEEEFTKLFRKNVGQISGLSTRGTKVFLYICDNLKPGQTSVHFMQSKCLEHTGYKTKGNIFSGLAELLEASIIARSQEPSLYFINPAVLFNGNRITVAKTYIKKKITDKLSTQLELELKPYMGLLELKEIAKNNGI